MRRLVTACLLAVFSSNALADENRGFFVEADVGQPRYDVSRQDLDHMVWLTFGGLGIPVAITSSTVDDGGSSWWLVSGWRLSPDLAVEVGYRDLGSAKYRASAMPSNPSTMPILAASADISSRGPTLAVAGFAPIGSKFDVHGRLGVYFADTTMRLGVSGTNSGRTSYFDATAGHSGRSQDLFGGIGAAFYFSKRLAVSLDYSLLKDVGDGEGPLFKGVGDTDVTGKRDIDSVTVGLRYAF
jgi:OmpA-like transmembrane domain